MKFKTLDDFNFLGKKVLVRSDLNSEVNKGKVVLGERIIESAKTIAELKKKGARVVVLSHQGRPEKKDFTSLEQHANLLGKYTKIRFVKGILGKNAIEEIRNLKNGEAILLDNIRKLKEEFNPGRDNLIVKVLGKEFDYYVNDSFSVSHRNQASVVGFPKVLRSCIGRLMQKEIESLNKVRTRKGLFILGGNKPEDNILLMNKGRVATCGTFGELCLMAKGYNLGAKSKVLGKDRGVLEKIKKSVLGVRTPIDLAVSVKGKRKEISLDELPSKYMSYDIGSRTIKLYSQLIKEADAIFMKGPAGMFETKGFDKGTKEILEAISKTKGFSVLGGGNLNSALSKFKINKNRFGYVSLSGGATIYYLAGMKLPGLEALKGK